MTTATNIAAAITNLIANMNGHAGFPSAAEKRLVAALEPLFAKPEPPPEACSSGFPNTERDKRERETREDLAKAMGLGLDTDWTALIEHARGIRRSAGELDTLRAQCSERSRVDGTRRQAFCDALGMHSSTSWEGLLAEVQERRAERKEHPGGESRYGIAPICEMLDIRHEGNCSLDGIEREVENLQHDSNDLTVILGMLGQMPFADAREEILRLQACEKKLVAIQNALKDK